MKSSTIMLIVLIILAIGFIIARIAAMRKHKIYIYNEHIIEVVTGCRFAKLIVDGIVVDELNASNITFVKLSASVEGIDIKSNIGTRFLTLKIRTFANNEELSETQVDKSDKADKSMFDEK